MPDHLEFVFEVGDRAQPADDHARADLLGEMDQQRVERLHRDRGAAVARERRGLAAQHRDALLDGERLRLRRIVGDADHQMIDQLHRALDDVRCDRA